MKPQHSRPCAALAAAILAALPGPQPATAAPIQSDTFTGTTIDAAKWQLPPYTRGNGTFTQNNGLFYHNNGSGTRNDWVNMWSNGTAPMASDWSVWFDARVPDLPAVAAVGQFVDLELKIWNTSTWDNKFDVQFGIGVAPAPYGRVRSIGADLTSDDWNPAFSTSAGAFFDVATQTEVSMGVSWQASTTTFSVWYAPSGGATDWVRLASWNLGPGSPFEWDLDPVGRFGLYIGGSSENVSLQAADGVRISNFVFSDSLISGRIPPTITTGTDPSGFDFQALPPAGIGTPYSTTIEAVGGALPYTWSVLLGSLPAGLVLDPATGTIHGTPTAAGFSKFRLRVTGADGAYAEGNYRITVMSEPGDDDFVGSYWPLVESHGNMRNFTGKLNQEEDIALTVSTSDESHYTLTLSDPAGFSFIIPDLLRTGNRLRNPIRPVVFPDFNLLDCIMLSDGVNRAAVQVAQESDDLDDIGFFVTSWSTHIGPVTTADFVGFWDIEAYGDSNLRDTAGGFDHETRTLEIRQLDAEHVQVLLPDGTQLPPLRVAGNQAFMATQPVIIGGARYHSFRIHTDGQRMSLHSVASELDDLTDVAVTIGLGVKVAPQTGPPVLATGTATDLTATTATLQGTVNPKGLATTAWFEYGPTTAYGSTAAVALSPNDGISTQDVSEVIEGLLPGHTYHYRLVASNSAGSTMGADRSFTTAVPPIDPSERIAPQIRFVGGNIEFTVEQSVAGRRYQLQQSETMEADTWVDVGFEWIGDGKVLVIPILHEPVVLKRFYRLALDPVRDLKSLVYIPAGEFLMGDQSSPLVGQSAERPVHTVYVSAFYMAKYETTKELWDEVRAWGMSHGYTDLPVGGGKAANHPVHSINWYAMVKWCNARSEKEGLAPCYTVSGATYKTSSNNAVECDWNATGYRLPTEAEWEKAARGGVVGKNFPWGTDTISHSQANYYSYWSGGAPYYSYDVSPTSGGHPTYAVGGFPYSSPVGSFAPNGYGLYDMAGNMTERCWDWYGSYSSASQADPRGPTSGLGRIVRGGDWYLNAEYARCSFRVSSHPGDTVFELGFRPARSLAVVMPGPPEATTLSVSDLTATGATLQGTVNPKGLATIAWFEYGPTTAYGSTAAVALSPNHGFSTQDVSAVIEGLLPGQICHYRLVASNSAGTITGVNESFVALTAPPINPAELVAPKIHFVDGNVEFTIEPTVSGRRYQLQQSETMEAGTWVDVGVECLGDGKVLVIRILHEPAVPKRFYRLALDQVAPAPEGFVLIPAGWFTMGRTSGDTAGNAPPTYVYVSELYMAKYEVTWELWNDVRSWAVNHGYTDITTGGGKAADHPVHTVSWWDVVKWCNARSEEEGFTAVYRNADGTVFKTGEIEPVADWNANGYRLPTEAEWEKAARGGVAGQRFPWGDEINHTHANYRAHGAYTIDTSPYTDWTYHPTYNDGTMPYTSPVGSFAANGYGLYDMAGNVREWCWDWYSASTYTEGASDPKGPASGSGRVLRGGSWDSNAFDCRSAHRSYDHGRWRINGFRPARSSVP